MNPDKFCNPTRAKPPDPINSDLKTGHYEKGENGIQIFVPDDRLSSGPADGRSRFDDKKVFDRIGDSSNENNQHDIFNSANIWQRGGENLWSQKNIEPAESLSREQCCGTYPKRFPFKTGHDDQRRCCGSRTYDSTIFECCADNELKNVCT